jgi:fluoride exporter
MGMALAYLMHSCGDNAWRLFAITGFLGGLTTFSAFSAEACYFLHRQQYAWRQGIF